MVQNRETHLSIFGFCVYRYTQSRKCARSREREMGLMSR
uniref:Uncharacterized protein MANES_08G151800 n=1 Tax=Rhizophora mucronata TaxID=61149 RepID=A0A2P2IPP5_RHIMU